MGKRRNEVPPHLFAVSDEAYRNILIGMISYDFINMITILSAEINFKHFIDKISDNETITGCFVIL